MRTNLGRIFGFFPRLLVEFLPGLFVVFFQWLFRRHERHYFVANEVVFQISHPANIPSPDILNAVRTFLPFNRNFFQELYVSLIPAASNDWRNRLNPPPESPTSTSPNSPTPASRVIRISSAEPFSLVPVRVAWHSRSGVRPVAVSKVLQIAYAQLQNGPIDLGNGISLRSISPNWFAKNLHHSGNTGGPGSWPLEVQSPNQSTRWSHQFLLPGSTVANAGGAVHVAILDTIPLQGFQSAAQSLMPSSVVTSALTPDYALIQYLFLSGSLDIHTYNNPSYPTELTDLHVYTPRAFHYEMPDHGSFIAGIIHTIAPGATIHLYEVLNSFGLGTLTSVAQSLIDVITNHYGTGNTPLIINCSFVLDPFTPSGDPTLTERLALTNPILLTNTTRDVLNWITSLNNVVIVAAAGNEANLGARPPAYYPAAFQGVIGVGALPNAYPTYPTGEYIPASYSNLSYDPANKTSSDGFMTFGGDIDNPGSPQSNVQPFASQGVLGVYMGDLPSRRTVNGPITRTGSTTGWARWAGTSFAAPIIAGFLAARWSGLGGRVLNYVNAQTELNSVRSPTRTHEGETVIQIQQGP